MAGKAARAKPILQSSLAEAAAQAAKLEKLLAAAKYLTAALESGRNPRRRRGAGENFWQFRLYQSGEEAAAIDWRRSGRDEHIYIRDKERETAQNICISPDLSASMRYKSAAALASKEERALLWLFVLAELAAKSGENVSVPALLPPSLNRNAAENIAAALAQNPAYAENFPIIADVPRFARLFIISDFLFAPAKLEALLAAAAENQTEINIIRIADPAERDFPFRGDVLFDDPETGQSRKFGRAEQMRESYLEIYARHRRQTEATAARYNAPLCDDATDRPPQEGLEKLQILLND